jgi:hypothetical protein
LNSSDGASDGYIRPEFTASQRRALKQGAALAAGRDSISGFSESLLLYNSHMEKINNPQQSEVSKKI